MLVGDGQASKTALRNALACRPNPRQEDPTIHLDTKKMTLTEDLDITVYRCGDQEQCVVTQLLAFLAAPCTWLSSRPNMRLMSMQMPLDNKLYRFLLVLQNRVPGAVILPVVTKIDTVDIRSYGVAGLRAKSKNGCKTRAKQLAALRACSRGHSRL